MPVPNINFFRFLCSSSHKLKFHFIFSRSNLWQCLRNTLAGYHGLISLKLKSFRFHLFQESSHCGTEFNVLNWWHIVMCYNLFIKVWSFTQEVQAFAGKYQGLTASPMQRSPVWRGHTPLQTAPTQTGHLQKGTGWEREAPPLGWSSLCLSVISKQPLWDFCQLQPAALLWSQSITYRLLPILPRQFNVTKWILYSAAANGKCICPLLLFWE